MVLRWPLAGRAVPDRALCGRTPSPPRPPGHSEARRAVGASRGMIVSLGTVGGAEAPCSHGALETWPGTPRFRPPSGPDTRQTRAGYGRPKFPQFLGLISSWGWPLRESLTTRQQRQEGRRCRRGLAAARGISSPNCGRLLPASRPPPARSLRSPRFRTRSPAPPNPPDFQVFLCILGTETYLPYYPVNVSPGHCASDVPHCRETFFTDRTDRHDCSRTCVPRRVKSRRAYNVGRNSNYFPK